MYQYDDTYMTPQECAKEFGKKLTRMMLIRGVTQKDLAFITGMPQSQISVYMSGTVNPTLHILDKLARGLGCSTDEFRRAMNNTVWFGE